MDHRLPIHLAIIQPPGYIHALGFLDQARYFRYQFRRLGAEVTLSKNRLREDAVNFVFGAHLGFPPEWKDRHPCIFVNLEQLGAGGAQLNAAYINLLKSSPVVDYDAANVPAYTHDVASVPVIGFGYAAYLHQETLPLEQRPIDLLFFGSMNERRKRFIDRVEAAGGAVTMFDHPIYGPERDHFIMQSKAVLNCHFYASNRFEQARAFHCLSLGTPMISERTSTTNPSPAFDDAIIWLEDEAIESYFLQTFNKDTFFSQAHTCLAAFRSNDPVHDPLEAYAELLVLAIELKNMHSERRNPAAWQPRAMNLGSGKDYKPNWLNVDILDRAEPDIVLDLGQAVTLPVVASTRFGGNLLLEAASLDLIYANNVLEHVPDLPALMTNALELLADGGEFHIEVPYERALTAWQDPTHLRALNENSWLYYTSWFWYLGWFSHRFELVEMTWLDMQLQPCEQDLAAFMRVHLRKVTTSMRERSTARMMQADFGGIDDDAIVIATEFE
jgi:hypothetical protein